MKKLILLMVVLIPAVALAQEAAKRDIDLIRVIDDNGVVIRKVNPTPQFALDALQAEEPWGRDAAWKVLRQSVEARSAAELDAFADALVRLIMLESPSSTMAARNALYVLGDVGSQPPPRTGIPYEGGLQVLTELYEAMDGTEAVSGFSVLGTIWLAGGEDYVRNLFASSERPEKPCWLPPPGRAILKGEEPKKVPVPPIEERCPYRTQWCEAGIVLGSVGIVDLNSIYSICNRRIRVDEDGRFVISSH